MKKLINSSTGTIVNSVENTKKQRRAAYELFKAEGQDRQMKDAAGISAAEAIEDRACEEHDAALEAVMRQKPTTLSGAAAYAGVADEQDSQTMTDWRFVS